MRRICLILMLACSLRTGLLAAATRSSGPAREVLREGHWLEARGRYEGGRFAAEEARILPPESKSTLIGVAERVDAANGSFQLLGRQVETSRRTQWETLTLGDLEGRRVKVEGSVRGAGVFSAREVSARGEGRERLVGRVDRIRPTSGGVELSLLGFEVFLPATVAIEHEGPLDRIPLAPRPSGAGPTLSGNEDKFFGQGYELGNGLRLNGQLETRGKEESNFDLDDGDAEDRQDLEGSLRVRLTWQAPAERLHGLLAVAEGRYEQLYRDDEEDGATQRGQARLGETYLFAPGLFGRELALQVGRQDFDEHREWIYDQNLDGVRLFGRSRAFAWEFSATTTLSDGNVRDESSTNFIAYISNGSRRRHLAAYAIYRTIDEPVRERPLHLGVRLLGKWLPQTESWLELAHLSGESADLRLSGWGLDLGATWSPDVWAPFSFTLGYALGTGSDTARRGGFRQTGFHDNTGKLGGLASFQYYGELLDPELANLHIATAGASARLTDELSLDLVVHGYRQDVAAQTLEDSDLDLRPSGLDADLGYEADLVLGRRWPIFDLELVGAYFRPGRAFPRADDAFLGRVKLRLKL